MSQYCIWAPLVLFSESSGREALSCQIVVRNALPFCVETSFLNSYLESEMCRLVKMDGEGKSLP